MPSKTEKSTTKKANSKKTAVKAKTAAKKPAVKKAAAKKSIVSKKAAAKSASKASSKKAPAKAKVTAAKPSNKKAVVKTKVSAKTKTIASKPIAKPSNKIAAKPSAKLASKPVAIKKAGVIKKINPEEPKINENLSNNNKSIVSNKPEPSTVVKTAPAAANANKAKAVEKPKASAPPAQPVKPVATAIKPAALGQTSAASHRKQVIKPAVGEIFLDPVATATMPLEGNGFMGIPPYQPKAGEAYMSDGQKEHFKKILRAWKQTLMEEVDKTVHHMQDEAANFPDPNDRATQEEEFSLELRARDRERKLIKKIEESLKNIDDDEYGFCDMCGVEIGIRRLEARPTATLCIDCKTMDEIRERQGN